MDLSPSSVYPDRCPSNRLSQKMKTENTMPEDQNKDKSPAPACESDMFAAEQGTARICRPASIQFWLASLVLACVVPVWIAAGFLIRFDYLSKRALTEQRMLETSRALTLVLDRDLANMQASLTDLATTSSFANGDLPAAYARAQLVVNSQPGADIILSDATGQELINTFRPFGSPLPKRGSLEGVNEVFTTGRPVIANVYKGASTEQLKVSVDVPVFRDGKVVYDLAMAVPPDRFSAIFAQQHLPPEWVGSIFDSHRIMVSRTRAAEQLAGHLAGLGIRKRMDDVAEGTAEVVNLEGVPMFDSFSESATSGWTVVIGVPRDFIRTEILRRLALTIAVTALLSLIGLALAFIMARRIAASIQGLIPPALALGRGETVAIGRFELFETSKVAASLLKASHLIQQRAAERERAQAARREAEELKHLNTELKRSEAEARARASELAAIMDAVPAITFIARDAECRSMTSNRAAYELLRIPFGTNTSAATQDYQPCAKYCSAKDGHELLPVELPMQMAAATGREVLDCEMIIAFEDGSSRCIFGNAVPLLDETGQVRGAVGAFIDISERNRTEEALRESEERFRQVVEGSPLGMFIQTDGLFRYLNPAALLMFGAKNPGELIEQKFLDRIHPDSHDQVLGRVRILEEERMPVPFIEHEYLRLDGSAFDVESTAIPFTFEARPGFIVFFREIGERKQEEGKRRTLEQQLLQAQKMEAIGRLAGGIAHDFNNLLMVIQSYTEMLQDSFPVQNAQWNSTQQIMKASERAVSLTGQLLAFSRKQVFSPAVLDLNAVIADAAKMLRRIIGEDIELQVHSDISLWAVTADPDQIVQVLMNLCVNARDAMAHGGTLTIATENITVGEERIAGRPYVSPGEYVSLSVTDTGVGISKSMQDQIFEPFFTTKEVGKGTGLGLAMVYGIVKQSGGYIWVDSELGQGAKFEIYLSREKNAVTHRIDGLGTCNGPHGTETLLVVEDEDALRDVMCDYLRGLGYTVLSANSGQQAIAVVSRHEHIDLLITDLVMPKMGGRELSQTLSTLRPGLKTIHMSGYTDDVVFQGGIHELGSMFLHKPFSLGTLAKKVREVLE